MPGGSTRRELRRLEHDHVADGEGGRDSAGELAQRGVPGRDVGDDAVWLVDGDRTAGAVDLDRGAVEMARG